MNGVVIPRDKSDSAEAVGKWATGSPQIVVYISKSPITGTALVTHFFRESLALPQENESLGRARENTQKRLVKVK